MPADRTLSKAYTHPDYVASEPGLHVASRLRCFLCQCNEDDKFAKSRLYKRVADRLAEVNERIVATLPGSDAAPWG